MSVYLAIGFLLYIVLLLNLPLLPNKTAGITHVKAMRGLLLVPVIAYLFYMTVFRAFSVGTDYIMYRNFFIRGDYTEQFDYFIVLIYDFARNEGDFLVFTFIITSLFLIFNLVAIRKITYNFFISFTFFVLSFYFFYVFNGMRQAVAISVIFLAVYFIQKEKMKIRDVLAYLLLIAIAVQFHISALFMLPLVFLRFFKTTKLIVLIAFAITMFGYFTPFVKNVLDDFLMLFDFYVQKYESDLDDFFAVNKEKSLVHFIPVVIQYFFLYFSLTLQSSKSRENKFLLNFYLAYLFLYSASGVEAIDRMQYYFYPSVILFYDYLIHAIYSNREDESGSRFIQVNKLMALASISFWFLYFVLRVYQGTGGITPYKFMA